jgi:hypothetical protein
MGLDISLYMEVDTGGSEPYGAELYEASITHNLGKMATEAGIYEALWRPGEHGFERAGDIVEILEKGLRDMESRPDHFRKFNPPNGWGTYEGFLPWVREYLDACKKHPKAKIDASR